MTYILATIGVVSIVVFILMNISAFFIARSDLKEERRRLREYGTIL